MNRQVINGQVVDVKPAIDHYIIKQKSSSNVEFYGFGPMGDIFIQFKNGISYIYLESGADLIKDMNEAESIGSFVSKTLVPLTKAKKLASVRWNERLVEPVIETPAGE